MPGGQQGHSRTDDDEVQVKPHQFGNESGIAFGLAVSPPVLNGDVLAIDIAEVAESLTECGDVRLIWSLWFRWDQDADAWDLRHLLCRSGERRNGQAESENDREPDPPHGHLV
jgi:hypothetical protein